MKNIKQYVLALLIICSVLTVGQARFFKDGFFPDNSNIKGDLKVSGDIDVNGSLLEDVTYISSTTFSGTESVTLTATQSGYIILKTTFAAITLVLPAASGNTGLSYTVVSSTAAEEGDPPTVTLDANASETINGETTNSDIDDWYDSLKITCDGTEWFITGGIIR